MNRYLCAVALFVFSVVSVGDAAAYAEGKRVALVIGNGAYAHAIALPNPVGDSKLIAQTLRSAGFSVIEGSDLDKGAMTRLLDQFTEAAYDADVAVVFYAGHGLQVDGRNYLIPVDAELEKAAQLQTRTIPVEAVLAALPPDPAVGVIILDACRDNPLARTLARALPVSRSSSVGAGLAPVQANGQSTNAGGLLIAYATDPGAVAFDGKDANSPYTTALARHLTTPGLEIQSALTRVRAEVSETTGGAQRPWHNASLAREVFIGGDTPVAKLSTAPEPVAAATQPAAGAEVAWTVEQKLWDEASKRNTIAHYELYLSQYPEGRFASVASLNLDQLKAAEVAGPPDAASAGEPEMKMASASQPRTALGVSDDIKQTPGTPETEAELKLDREKRIDLQLRLSALGFSTGGFDGSLGPRSRTAIGAWQRQSGIVETTYLTPQQHMFLSSQTDPLIAQVRAQYESDKAAAQKRAAAAQKVQKEQKVVRTKTKASKKKSQQTAGTTTRRKQPTQTADDIPYKPRNSTRTRVDDGDDGGAGAFAAGALLGTAVGVVVGKQ